MELKVDSNVLVACLGKLNKIISNRPPIESLNNLLIHVAVDHMVIAASDGEIYMEISIPCECGDSFGFMVPPTHFIPLVSDLPAQSLRFVFNNNNCTVSHENGHFSLPVDWDINRFPLPPSNNTDAVINLLPLDIFCNSYALIVPFVEKPDESIPSVFASVNFDLTEKGLCVVCSNRSALAIREMTAENIVPTSFMISSKAVSLFKSFKDLPAETEVTVKNDSCFVFIETESMKMIVRKSEGRFPDYRTVIPSHFNYMAEVNRGALKTSLLRMNSICGNHVIVASFDEGTLRLTAEDIDFDIHSEDTISCEFTGDNLVVGFHNVMLQNAIKVLPAESIKIDMVAPDKAVKITPLTDDTSIRDTIIMSPMVV